MKRLAGYPPWFFHALLLTVLILLATGVVLLPPMLKMRLELDIPWHVAGQTRLVATVGHCATGFLMASIVGALLAIHVRIGWRRRLNRISGTALLALITVMMITPLGIYYFGDESWSRLSSLLHSCAGLLATPIFIWHAIKGWRLRRDASVWKHTQPNIEQKRVAGIVS